MKKNSVEIELPKKLVPLLTPPLGTFRYRCAYGGRGGAKSFSFALMSVIFGVQKKISVLCVRQFFTSVAKSFYKELIAAIEFSPWLKQFYTIKKTEIVGNNGTTFEFGGLEININNVKGATQFDLWIVDEAEDVCEMAWQVFPQSVRKVNSEIWVIFNPQKKDSPTDLRFRQKPPQNSKVVELQYYDNPFFPDILNRERLRDKEILNSATYKWIWFGDYLEMTEAQIFKDKYIVQDFKPGWDWDGPYLGLDFGFSVDPTAAVKFWIYENILYIEYDAGQVGLELDETVEFLSKAIPDFTKHIVVADNARPESISYLKRFGLPLIEPAKKGPNSVKEGLTKLLSYKKIVIHSRCRNTLSEFKNYSYKVDKHTSRITSLIIDANNHYIDAIRYGAEQIGTNWDYRNLI